MGLLARTIEGAGIATVVLGSARDIMVQVKAPRSVFVDFPLGHQAGKPFDLPLQLSIVKDALQALVSLKEPGCIVDLPYRWGSDFSFEPGAYRRSTGEK